MKALHFGAGNIGRGFIGKLLSDAEVSVIFADVDQRIVDDIANRHQYPVNVVGNDSIIEVVKNVDAVSSLSPKLIEIIAKVDLITTAVGPQVLTKIAETTAKGLIERYKKNKTSPLNIIACENMVRGTSQFKKEIFNHLPDNMYSWVNKHVGFVDSAVDRIVPPAVSKKNDLLEVTVEHFSEWIVDQNQFIGTIPKIRGMEPVNDLMAFVERKLFTLNTGHAITAYLGFYYGIDDIRNAILDERICKIVRKAMQESGAVLVQRYKFDLKIHNMYIDKILSRFENPFLHDETSRVGRQPIRKLSAGDRLIKPLLGSFEYKTSNDNLLIGIAAALNYRNAQDEQAIILEDMINTKGVKRTLSDISEIDINNPVLDKIVNIYIAMQKGQPF